MDGDYERDEEGFFLDEGGNQVGYCNSCGEEATTAQGCCDDGEVVPYD